MPRLPELRIVTGPFCDIFGEPMEGGEMTQFPAPHLGAACGYEVCEIPISQIRRDGGTQHRIRVSPSVVARYAELMRAGVDYPPVRVWRDVRTSG